MSDGSRSYFGDLSSIKPGRSERLLQFLLTTHALSGEKHWLDLYHEKMMEAGRARLSSSYGPQRHNPYTSFHGLVQSQVSLRVLLELEEDETIRSCYRRTLADHASRVMPKIDRWYEYTQPYYDVREDDLETVWNEYWEVYSRRVRRRSESQCRYNVRLWYDYMKRHDLFPAPPRTVPWWESFLRPICCPVELPMLWEFLSALASVMLSEDAALKADAAEKAWPLLAGLDWSDPPSTGSLAFLELAYWPGVAAGVFPLNDS
jgi:hypothetical protein